MSPRAPIVIVGTALLVFAGSLFLLQRPDRSASATTQSSRPQATVPHSTPLPNGTSNLRETAVAAIERARIQFSGDALKDALADAIATLAESDPAAAVEFAASLATDEERMACLHESWPLWLKTDRTAASAWAKRAVGSFSSDLTLALVHDTAAVDGDLALSLTTGLPVGPRGSSVADVFETWAAIDPSAAAVRARSLVNSARDPREVADTGDREVAAVNVIRSWATRDPQKARDWALSLPETAVRRAALENLFSTWASTDPANAAASAAGLPDTEPSRVRLVDRIIVHWSATDAPAALGWVQTVKDTPVREAAATTLLSEVVQTQPNEAAAWALQLSPDPGSPLVSKVVAAWAAIDARAARQWVTNLPPGAARDDYLRNLPENGLK